MDEVNITVVGAGVIGLAVAAELAQRYTDIVVLERHPKFGQETSSRNSEVIHAGIYYPAGSLKAQLCVEGAERLYRHCEESGVPHARIGKLIVATEPGEIRELEVLLEKGRGNGVRDLKILSGAEAVAMEPNVHAVAALHSPNTGILDTHALMAGLHARAEARGATFAFGCEVSAIEKEGAGYVVRVSGEDYSLRTRVVINCAGLSADRVAAMMGIPVDEAGYRIRYCKGCYFAYARKSPVTRLVYPVPHADLAGLGVHATLDLAGSLRFGPDTEYIDQIDYDVDPARAPLFFAGADKIIRGLDAQAIVPGMAGVRPKLAGDGVRDFVIRHEADRGLPGAINLVGMESPGLTACLAIARKVAALVREAS